MQFLRKLPLFTIVLLGGSIVLFCFIVLLLVVIQQISYPKTPAAVLAPYIVMGEVELKVANTAPMTDFYTSKLGMQVISKNQIATVLGYNKQPILTLDYTPSLRSSSPSDPGLDQIAIVFQSRSGLARVLQRIISTDPSLYAGGTNRGTVGEAFYVTDPQGNSLELYYDTDPSTWPRTTTGSVEGDSLPIDINQYIRQYAGESGNNAMKLGHLQIRVGDIAQGKQFYIQTVGFYAVPMLLGGNSIFMSDGYYHHDFVINQIRGYDGDTVDAYQGLKGFSMTLPTRSYINQLANRLHAAHVTYQMKDNTIVFKDPWGIQIAVGTVDNNLLENLISLLAL